jgi:hypothetical protein
MLGKNLIQAAAGAAGAGGGVLGVEDVFSTWLYTGNGSTQTITNGIDLSGEGGLVWIKKRSGSQNNRLQDTTRGITNSLISNAVSASTASSTRVNAVSSTGFSVGSDSDVNESAATYASWTFRKAEKFFDVVTYTGDGVASRQVAHSLNSGPGSIIVKCTNTTSDWWVWHRGDGATARYMRLNTTAADSGSWSVQPVSGSESTVFEIRGGTSHPNVLGNTYVAYLFAHDAGGFGDSGDDSVVKCGGFTCDGSGLATVDLGWEPQWVLIKRTNSTNNWELVDTMRGFTQNNLGVGTVDNARLFPNLSNAEIAFPTLGLTSTGFLTAASLGASNTYIYIAIRRGPMKTPTDATEVFNVAFKTGGSGLPAYKAGFPIDMAIREDEISGSSFGSYILSRLTGTRQIPTTSTAAETTNSSMKMDYMTGFNADAFDSTDTLAWMFRRAPGFFDVVAYTGTGSARTVAHNLGVAPELMIVKARSNAGSWEGYHAATGATKTIRLNSNGAEIVTTGVWNDTAPASTVFTVGTASNTNGSGYTHIAYLFATCPGVSRSAATPALAPRSTSTAGLRQVQGSC